MIALPTKTLWLVDAYFWTEEAYRKFRDMLDREFPKWPLTRLVVSHFHYDHIRFAQRVVSDLTPAQVVVPDAAHGTGTARNFLRACQQNLRVLHEPEQSLFGDLRVRLDGTGSFCASDELGPSPNEHAIAVSLRTQRSIVLLAADIPGNLLRSLVCTSFYVDGFTEQPRRFYKVTHHCSRTGADARFLLAFPPDEAATSCGMFNRWGHPHNPPRLELDRLTAGRHRMTPDGPIEFRIS